MTTREEAARAAIEEHAGLMTAHERDGRRLFKQRNQLWVRASKAGISVAEIAELYGVEQQTVRVFLRREGAGRRSTE